VQLPLLPQHGAEVVVGQSEIRVKFEGLLVADNGLIQLPLVLQGIAEVVVALGGWGEFDGFLVAGDGLVQLPLLVQRVAEVVLGAAPAGPASSLPLRGPPPRPEATSPADGESGPEVRALGWRRQSSPGPLDPAAPTRRAPRCARGRDRPPAPPPRCASSSRHF